MTYTSPTIYPSNIQWVGIGPETVAYGTAAAAPLIWVPVTPGSAKWKPNQTMLKDDGLRGDMGVQHGVTAGVRYDTFDYGFYGAIDTIFPHMQAVYGSTDTMTGSSDPYTHVCSLLNSGTFQPISSTLWLSNGAECWQITGAQLGQLDVDTKVAERVALTASWMGLPATKVTAPSNTPSTKAIWASWNSTLTIGGTATAGNYSDVKLTFKRENEATFGFAGSQSPYVIFAGTLAVTGSMTSIYQGYTATTSDLANYLANTQPALVLKVSPVGDSTHYAQWGFTSMAYDNVEVSGSNKWQEATATLSAIDTTTDATSSGASPGKFTLLTSVSAVYTW